MEPIKRRIKDESALLEKFGADIRYNPPDSYGKKESFFGDGKYPPDWANRRSAIWWLQENQCGRCAQPQEDGAGHVHHIKPLSTGGGNALDNLVGLCADCHAVLHPEVDDLNGNWTAAPQFPSPVAEPGVAVIRKEANTAGTDIPDGIASDLDTLAEETSPIKNAYSTQSSAVYGIDSKLSRTLAAKTNETKSGQSLLEALNDELLTRGRVPENESYATHRLTVETPLSGMLGWLSSFQPTVSVEPITSAGSGHGNVVMEERDAGNGGVEFLFSDAVEGVRVHVTDGSGKTVEKRFSFDNALSQSATIPVSPPSLSLTTAGSYARNLGRKTHLFTIIYGLLGLFLVPLAGIVLLFSVFGMLMGAAGTAGWFIIALLFGGSWWMVGELALATFIALILGSIAIAVLEQFGIDVGE